MNLKLTKIGCTVFASLFFSVLFNYFYCLFFQSAQIEVSLQGLTFLFPVSYICLLLVIYLLLNFLFYIIFLKNIKTKFSKFITWGFFACISYFIFVFIFKTEWFVDWLSVYFNTFIDHSFPKIDLWIMVNPLKLFFTRFLVYIHFPLVLFAVFLKLKSK